MASANGTADGLEPLWSGEPSTALPGPYTCPEQVSLARKILYIIQYGEDAVFLVDNLNRISDGGYSSNGDPMATYAVGPRSFNSVSPWQKYTMRGGNMRARCQVKTVRTGMGFRVILGPIIWYDYTGEIDLASNDGTFGGQSRGWSFSNHASVTGAGSGNDGTTPQSVMD